MIKNFPVSINTAELDLGVTSEILCVYMVCSLFFFLVHRFFFPVAYIPVPSLVVLFCV